MQTSTQGLFQCVAQFILKGREDHFNHESGEVSLNCQLPVSAVLVIRFQSQMLLSLRVKHISPTGPRVQIHA